ncbi:hypothetical protein SK128_016424 [Halocaridina rubra]|uniref:Kelch domain-containing protein 2 n=1 Tax=Halocaridina rubra TaxID=373956 RepID=A0AAN8WPL2_HALRR
MARREPEEHQFVHRRTGHIMVAYDQRLYVWGGFMELPHSEPYTVMTQSHTIYHSAIDVWVYDPLLDTWFRKMSRGDIPLQLSGACAAVHQHYMYLFGGLANGENDFSVITNSLWRLYLPTLTWELLTPDGDLPLACDKAACWVYKNRFYVFGGFGPADNLIQRLHRKVLFVRDAVYSRGWNDQLVYYDIETNSWVWPETYGERPTPRAAHSADIVGDTVYIFGGRFKNTRMNDLHCLHLISNHWSGNLTDSEVQNAPEGRSWHTFNFINDRKAVVYGGFNATQQVLKDIWILNIEKQLWQRVDNDNAKPALWHTSSIAYPGEVFCYGGLRNNILDYSVPKDHAEEMLVLRFSPPTLQRLTLEAICRYSKRLQRQITTLPQNLQLVLKYRSAVEEIS